jgi:hypothetical protein
MRWAIVAVLFLIAVFGFFIGYAVSSFLLSTVQDAMTPFGEQLTDSTAYLSQLTLISTGFGIICAIAFTLLIVIFALDSLSDEPENYWRE